MTLLFLIAMMIQPNEYIVLINGHRSIETVDASLFENINCYVVSPNRITTNFDNAKIFPNKLEAKIYAINIESYYRYNGWFVTAYPLKVDQWAKKRPLNYSKTVSKWRKKYL